MNNAKRLYRVNEFLAAFGIGRTKFYSEVRAGRLRVVRFGERATRILAEDAEEWLRNATLTSTHTFEPDCQRPKSDNGEQQKQQMTGKANSANGLNERRRTATNTNSTDKPSVWGH